MLSETEFPKGGQDELDWSVFAKEFEKQNGFAPHPRDVGHGEFFHWFRVGAHEEFMGRLNRKKE